LLILYFASPFAISSSSFLLQVGFTTMERWLTFSPAKNDPESGAAAAAKGSPSGAPASSEADFYAAYRHTLTKATGCQIEAGEKQVFAGMEVKGKEFIRLCFNNLIAKNTRGNERWHHASRKREIKKSTIRFSGGYLKLFRKKENTTSSSSLSLFLSLFPRF